MKKLVSIILVLAMILMLGVSAFASDEASAEASASASGETSADASPVVEISGPTTAEQSGWMYTEEDGVITIIQAPQSVKSEMVVLIPGYIGTETVDALGNGGSVMSNNKLDGSYVLFPEELGYIASSAIHDFNDTIAWIIPETVEVADTPWLSCSGYVIAAEGSSAAAAAEYNGKEVVSIEGCSIFVVDAGENGTITPAGTYYVPEDVYGLSTELTVSAAEGYKIASITVDGETTVFDELTQEFTLVYTFSEDYSAVEAAFVELAEDEVETRTFGTGDEYSYVDIVDGAVADGVELPEDLYEVQNPNTSVTDYVHALGVSTGVYYVYEGSLYEEIYSSQATEIEYLTKAEAINGVYESEGLVYGEDYDIIRLHNYYANITSGPSTGVVAMYCTYLYKLVDESSEDGSLLDGETIYSADNVDHAAVFVQGTGTYTIDDLIVFCYTSGRGPSESGNFYGVGSQVHVDGGTEGILETSDIHYDTATLILNQVQILGTNNSIYSTGSGLAIINGGDIFACSSGGHGPYVSQGGQILINVDGTNLINEDGSINIVDPEATEIPDYSYAGMTQDENGENVLDITEHPDDVTVIVSGLDAGTALATDKGGGTIVANQVVTKCYGLRSAGVYTIGYSESWVYVFNSNCTSNLDAALCSASAGYAYAFNCRLQGCMGLKVRASGTSSTEDAGVWVENCRVSAYYDAEEEEEAYLVGSPDEFLDLIGEEAGIEPQQEGETYAEYLTRADAALYQYIVEEGNSYGTSMNIFIDSANTPHYNENGILWWYLDRSKTPGYSGGNKFAVIYSDGSPAVVSVTASLLINDNYTYYGEDSDWWNSLTEEEQSYYTPADNLIASAENGGQLNVTFTDENSSTYWDVTGESDETCEMSGDFYVGGKSTNGINATFINSEWTGTIIFEEPASEGDTIGTAYIVLTEGSVWTVTEECTVNGLTVDETSTIIGTVTENEDGTYTITPSDEATSGIEAAESDAASDEAAASAEAASDEAVVSVEAASGEAAALEGKDAFDAYVQYLRDFMDTYDGDGDGSGFDDGAKTMALGELDTVAYGDDVNEFPFEMFVSQFGADDYDTWLASLS